MSVLSQVLQSQGQQDSCRTVCYFLVWVLDSGSEWCCSAAESHILKARAFGGDQRKNTADLSSCCAFLAVLDRKNSSI